MSESKTLWAALLDARKAVKPLIKGARNPHFNSKYADLDACYEAIDDALLSNGLLTEQRLLEREEGTFLETRIRHAATGEATDASELKLILQKNDMQGKGAAITYARRFSIMTAMQLAPEDDDGQGAGVDSGKKTQPRKEAQKVTTPAPSETATPSQIAKLFATLNENGIREQVAQRAWIRALVGRDFASTKELTKAEVSTLIEKAQNGEMPQKGAA